MSATLQQIYNVVFGAPALRQRFVAARLSDEAVARVREAAR